MTVTGGRLDIVIHASRPTPAGFSQSKLIRPREVVLPQLRQRRGLPGPLPWTMSRRRRRQARPTVLRGTLEPEADFHGHLEVADVSVLDVTG